MRRGTIVAVVLLAPSPALAPAELEQVSPTPQVYETGTYDFAGVARSPAWSSRPTTS